LEITTEMITIKYPTTEAVLDFEKKVDKKKHNEINTFPQSIKKINKRRGLFDLFILIKNFEKKRGKKKKKKKNTKFV